MESRCRRRDRGAPHFGGVGGFLGENTLRVRGEDALITDAVYGVAQLCAADVSDHDLGGAVFDDGEALESVLV